MTSPSRHIDDKGDKTPIAISFSMLLVGMIPIFTAQIYPFTDYPLHLSLIKILIGLTGLGQYAVGEFTFNVFTPYVLPFFGGSIIGAITGVEAAGKILILFYFAGTLASIMFLYFNLKISLWYSVFIIPFFYNFSLAWGFLPFLVSLPLLFCVLALAIRTIDGKNKKSICFLAIANVVLVFTHLFSFLIALPLIVTILLMSKKRIIHRFLEIIAVVTPASFIALFWRLSTETSAADQIFLSKGTRFAPLGLKLKFFPDYLISGDSGTLYRWVFWIVIVLIGITGILNYFSQRKTPRDRRLLLRFLLLGVVLVEYLLCPYSLLTAVWLFNRMAFVVMILAIPVFPSQFNRASKWMTIPMGLIILVFSIQTTQKYLEFERDAQGGLQCMEDAGSGKSMRYLNINGRSLCCDHTPFDHFNQYYFLRNNGRVFNPFSVLMHMPARYRFDEMKRYSTFKPKIRIEEKKLKVDLNFNASEVFLVRFPFEGSHDWVELVFQEKIRDVEPIGEYGVWKIYGKRSQI